MTPLPGPPEPRAATTPLAQTLEPEQVGPQHFVHVPITGPGHRVFGGLLLAQGLVAAGRTVSDSRLPHSLHADFLHPVDGGSPIDLRVEVLRETRAFSTRRTTVRQDGREVFTMTSSFHTDEVGIESQLAMPAALPPDDFPDWGNRLASKARYGTLAQVEWPALDVRGNDDSVRADHPFLQTWLRTRDPLPEDPLLHAAALAYISDLTMLASVPLPPDPSGSKQYVIASLGHSMWFFHAMRADEWLLHDQRSPASRGGLALATGNVFTRDGRLMAATAQEGLIRGGSQGPGA